MAGLIAGRGQAGNGALGIAPASKIFPIRQNTTDGKGGPGEIARSVDIARQQSVDVINISLSTAPAARLDTAIKEAIKADIVVVAGIGNTSNSSVSRSPADIPGVLAVGAVGKDGEHADVSTSGEETQLCAPGVDIATTDRGGKYSSSSGTSPASAIVSGAVALIRAKFPNLSGPEVVHRLTATADDIGPPGRDDECGFGVLNIVEALTAEVPPVAVPTETASSAPSQAASSAKALPATEPAGKTTLPTVVVGAGVLIVLGGLTAFLVWRKRKS